MPKLFNNPQNMQTGAEDDTTGKKMLTKVSGVGVYVENSFDVPKYASRSYVLFSPAEVRGMVAQADIDLGRPYTAAQTIRAILCKRAIEVVLGDAKDVEVAYKFKDKRKPHYIEHLFTVSIMSVPVGSFSAYLDGDSAPFCDGV